MPDKTVVVLGGGAGGLVTAHHLARTKDGHRIVLVERDPVYHFPPSLLWVLSGARRPEQITVDLRRLTTRRGIELTQADVQAIDVDAGRIETSTGPIPYDRLVVALGAELAPDILPGFTQGAHNVYTLEGRRLRRPCARGAPGRSRRRVRLTSSLQVPGGALRDGPARRGATPQTRRA